MDSARLARAVGSNRVLGCIGPGSTRSIGISFDSSRGSTVWSEDRSAPNPRPSALRFIDYLLSKLLVSDRSLGLCVICNDRFTVARRLSQTDVAWYDRGKHLLSVKISQICGDSR